MYSYQYISIYNEIVLVLRDAMFMDQRTLWLKAVLILPLDGSANSGLQLLSRQGIMVIKNRY
jgi:hypothetical protein